MIVFFKVNISGKSLFCRSAQKLDFRAYILYNTRSGGLFAINPDWRSSMNAEMELERILFIATQMEARGTNEYVSYLAGDLRKKGFDVAVFCAPGPMLEVLEKKGVPAKTFKHLAGARFPSRRRAEFMESLREFSPDIVHMPDLRALQSYRDVARGYEAPTVVTMHAAPQRARTFRALAPDLSGILVTSQKVREEIVNDFKFPKNKIVMICNGIDIEEINCKTTRPVFSRSLPVIGSVGPVERSRGHELFIRAASLLIQSGKKAQFVIAGEGEEISSLSRLASEAGLDKCLTFARDFAAYHEVLDALDVVVQSAQVDVSGFSMLDAMACGRPVVAFNTGTACEIITDGKTGLIVPQEDAESLAAAMAQLTDNPELGPQLGEEARRSVREKFNISKTAGSVVEFYRQIVAEHD